MSSIISFVALSHNARVLILDEPTSGLDPFSRDELSGLVRGAQEPRCRGILLHAYYFRYREVRGRYRSLSRGEIVAALPKAEFVSRFSKDGETIEENHTAHGKEREQCVKL